VFPPDTGGMHHLKTPKSKQVIIIIIIIIQDSYSPMMSEDTDALGGARLRQVA